MRTAGPADSHQNITSDINEKTLEIIRKSRVFDNRENSEVDGARTRNLRIDSSELFAIVWISRDFR
jgi:hypothetical protein